MIYRDDVFRCVNGRCEFLAKGRTPITINDRTSFHRPHTRVHYVAASVFAEALQTPLHCVIETVTTEGGFEYRFRSSPNMALERVPGGIILSLDRIYAWLDRARDDKPRPGRIDGYVNADGQQALGWMLEALYGEAFTLTASEVQFSWRPTSRPRFPSQPPPRHP